MLNVKELVISTNGKLLNGENENIIPKNYILDSRELKEDSFFIPLIGNKVNGNNYIIDVVKSGSIGYFINKNTKNKLEIINATIAVNSSVYIIEVNDTLKALQDAAMYNRCKHIDIPIVAITGSVGKTSTREMISSILSQEKKTLTTEKNYNGSIGLPLMLLKISNQDVCILEAGIDTIGEMELLSNLLKPDIAVITKIGTSHIEFFKTQEKIFSEKMQIASHIKGLKLLIVNGEDKFLRDVCDNEKYSVKKFLKQEASDIVNKNEKTMFKTKIYSEDINVEINQLGQHNIENALCAIKVAEIFKISKENILQGIVKYKNFERRLEKIIIGNDITLIDDTYNASIDSMKSGLITVDNCYTSRKIAVLGNMLELGTYTEKLHREVGLQFRDLNYNALYTLGDFAKFIAIEAKNYVKNIKSFNTKEELEIELKSFLHCNDVIYLKASNIMKFNEIILKLKDWYKI